MNSDVTVRDVMTREFVGVSESDDVRSTAGLMLEEGTDCVVVLRGRESVGLLTEREVLELVSEGATPETTTVGSVMRETGPSVGPGAGLDAALDTMATADRKHLLVGGDEVEGVLSEHDLLSAAALEHYEEPDRLADVAANGRAPEGFGADPYEPDAFGAGADPTERTDRAVSEQSICQECGALSRDLLEREGQLLCADCREV